MKRCNYLDEKIPDYKLISTSIIEILAKIRPSRQYSFDELFSLHPKGFYEKNYQEFEKIGFNSRLNEKDKKENEIKGLYIFYKNENPVYTGISRKLIRRLRNHFLGKSHFEASLVYLIARDNYDKTYGTYMKTRNEFPFDDYRENIQKSMIDTWKISIFPEEDNYKLHLLELAVSCEFETKWNSFETH